MASKTQKARKIRKRKHRPNKDNIKVQENRIRENLKVLDKVVETDK